MYVVVLAGGGGTRLWPLSTPERPKPFLPLLPDGESLFERTLARLVGPELPLEPTRDLFVVVDRRFADLAAGQAAGAVPGLPSDHVIAEPTGRNTAAAIALATIAIERPEDEVMVVLPADHRIDPGREGVFRDILAAAADELTGAFPGIPDALVTLGVQPDRPATGYGYLRPDVTRRRAARLTAYPLLAFVEKPDPARAAELVAEAGVAWNAGMFLWHRRAIRAALARYPQAAPIWAAVEAGHRSGDLAAAYEALAPHATSIDYAVLEPAAAEGRVVMGALDVGWSDLGSWQALLEALGAPGIAGRVVPAGERVELGPGDLLVECEGWPAAGRLHLRHGPATMGPFDRPTAVLPAAAHHDAIVAALLERARARKD